MSANVDNGKRGISFGFVFERPSRVSGLQGEPLGNGSCLREVRVGKALSKGVTLPTTRRGPATAAPPSASHSSFHAPMLLRRSTIFHDPGLPRRVCERNSNSSTSRVRIKDFCVVISVFAAIGDSLRSPNSFTLSRIYSQSWISLERPNQEDSLRSRTRPSGLSGRLDRLSEAQRSDGTSAGTQSSGERGNAQTTRTRSSQLRRTQTPNGAREHPLASGPRVGTATQAALWR